MKLMGWKGGTKNWPAGGDSAPLCVFLFFILFNIFDSLSSVLQVNMSPLFQRLTILWPSLLFNVVSLPHNQREGVGTFVDFKKKTKREKKRICVS